MARWESEVLAEMPGGYHTGDPPFSGEIQPASGYIETHLFGPTAGYHWRTGKGMPWPKTGHPPPDRAGPPSSRRALLLPARRVKS
jgi:hypothetical protein